MTAYPFEQEARHIASGVNSAGEVRGLFLSGRHVGITATDIRAGLLDELDAFAGPGMSLVFVDSGAFSEVEFGPAGPVVVREITEAMWDAIFAVYRRIACGYGTKARIVAPDRVGDQAVTLARLERYAAEVQAIAIATRCGVIVPVQKGSLPVGEFWRRATAILGLRGLIAGVPMKKDATSIAELGELAAALPVDGARVHLLGIGPESKRFAAAIAAIRAARPDADITSDSVTVRRLVGRTNGRGGGPRALTAAQDAARARGITDPTEVKAHALITQGFAEIDAEKARARELGWRDEGDDDTEPTTNAQEDLQPMTSSTRTIIRPPAIRAFLGDEIVADNFAGGGGASSGIEIALGRSPDLAINHDDEAIAMHRANHPTTNHYTESVWDVDPVEACGGKPVALAWFSPDCKHHSKAKGGKPREQKLRGLAWSAVRWAHAVRPRVIALENVEEFKDWGPLHRHVPTCKPRTVVGELRCSTKRCRFGKPIAARKGQTFRAFVRKLRGYGYEVEWRLLRACDFGAPTSRRRLFMVARSDGRAIAWPTPTHGGLPGLLPFRTAAECIDWSIPCPSIFERERALSPKTEARIARGIRKFVLEAARPFIVPVQTHGGGGNGPSSIDAPLRTITASKRGTFALAVPTLVRYNGERRPGEADRSPALDAPLPTLTTEPRFALAVSYLVHRSNGERPGQAPRIYDIERPLGTVVAQGQKHAVCTAFLAKNYGGHESSGSALSSPVATITTRDHHSLVAALLVRYNGTGEAEPVDRPLGTLTTRDRYGLVTVRIDGEEWAIVDIGMRMLTPRELFRAQGFAESYTIAPQHEGKPLTRTAQVRMCGNSVCPPVAAAVVRAQLEAA